MRGPFGAGKRWRFMSDPRLIDLALEFRHETPKAYLIYDGGQEVWLPKSLVEYDTRDKVFTMPDWLAKDKGLS